MKTFLFVVKLSVMIPLIVMMFFYMVLITIFILPIEVAPQMFDIIEKIAQGIDIYEIEDLVTEAEEIVTKLNSIKPTKGNDF
jgi:hypothetical protein